MAREKTWRVDVRERKAMQKVMRRQRHCGLSYLIVAVTIASAALATNTAIAPVSKAGKATWMARHQAMNARVQQGHIDLIYMGDSIVEGYETQGKDSTTYYPCRQLTQ